MENLFETVIFAFFFVAAALLLIGIGWLVSGKLSIKRGACGRDPTKKRDENCDVENSCHICHPSRKKRDEDEYE